MPRDRIKLADAKALIADGHATPESIAANFDVEDDGSAETPAPAAPSRLETARARVSTPTLDRLGLTGEDVKAGRGPQPAGFGAKVAGAGVDAVTGVVDALGGLEVYNALGAGDAVTYYSDVPSSEGGHCSNRAEWAAPLKNNIERFLKKTGNAPGVIKAAPNQTGDLSTWRSWTTPTLN